MCYLRLFEKKTALSGQWDKADVTKSAEFFVIIWFIRANCTLFCIIWIICTLDNTLRFFFDNYMTLEQAHLGSNSRNIELFFQTVAIDSQEE